MTEILTSELRDAHARLAGLEHDPVKRAQIIDAATQCAAMGGQSFLDLVDVLGKIMAKASLDAEDMRQLSADGIDIRPAIEQIRRQTLAPFIHRTRLWKDRHTGRWDWSCATCPAKGASFWHEGTVTPVERLALITCEVSEAIEEVRDGHCVDEAYYNGTKPEGVPAELADVVIRCLDFADFYGIDLEAAIVEKVAYNRTRGYRHGGKVL